MFLRCGSRHGSGIAFEQADSVLQLEGSPAGPDSMSAHK